MVLWTLMTVKFQMMRCLVKLMKASLTLKFVLVLLA